MKNMKVKAKLLLTFAIVAVMVLSAGVVGIIGLNTLNRNEEVMYDYAVSANNASLIRRNMQAQRAAYRGAAAKEMLGMEYESEFDILTTLDADFDELFSTLEKELKLQENKDRLATAKKAYTEYETLRDSFVAAVRSGNQTTMSDVFKKILDPIDRVVSNLDQISVSAIKSVEDRNIEDGKTANFLIILLVSVVVLAVGVAITFAFYVSGLISKPLALLTVFMNKAGTTGDIALSRDDEETIKAYSNVKDEVGQCIGSTANFVKHLTDVSQALETIANGDLTVDLPPLSDHDTMILSLRKMTDNLNQMFSEIRAASSQVTIGANQVANGSQSLAQGATEQASSVEELSASINEIADKTKRNAVMAGEAARLSSEINNNAEKGSQQMDNLMQAVTEINDASQSINKVIKVIDDIAFQTNILALNAAVEAARAGAAGKGFAVVADEVRNLASKSAEAAKDTSSMIENSIEKSNLGLSIAKDTATSLNDIVDGINHSAEIVTQIAQSSDEQAISISQINTGIEQVSQVVQQNSATAEESAAASEEMSGQASLLQDLIKKFKLRESGSGRFEVDSYGSGSTYKKQREVSRSSAYDSGDYGKY